MVFFAFFADIFGYLLNFLNSFVGNYGVAIILFSLVIKILMIPLSVKQQRSLKKTSKLQGKLKEIQFKYKNDPEKLNQATWDLYKTEKVNPLSGCLTAIIQVILLLSVFFMVKEPLTYVQKVDSDIISYYVNILTEKGLVQSEYYEEISVISESNTIKEELELQIANQENKTEEEISLEQKAQENIDQIYLNMNFLGIDLSKVPTQSLTDYRVYIIPILYVISSFISMRLVTSMQAKSMKKENQEDNEENNEVDPMVQANKSMALIIPIMSISISLFAPLGLALYWLINNILMIIEKLILNKVIKDEEE